MIRPWLKHWPEGVPYSINYPRIPVNAFLENSARKYPNRTALVFMGSSISYSSLGKTASKFANALQHLGITKGDRVALLLPNIPQFVIAYYGILSAGGTVVAINPLNEAKEIERQMQDSRAQTLIVLDRFLEKVDKKDSDLKKLIIARAENYLPFASRMLSKVRRKTTQAGDHLQFETLLNNQPPPPQTVPINPMEDLAVIQYTGGTTGRPKGAMLTHHNLVANTIQTYHWLRGWGQSKKPQGQGHPIVLAAVPFFHIYGMTVALNEAVHAGSTIVLVPKPEAVDMIRAIEQNEVTHLPATPNIYRAILGHPSLHKEQLSSLTHCVSGGDPIDIETAQRFKDVCGAELYEGYGLTEASPVTHCTTLDDQPPRRGSIGIPFPDTDARIVDLLTGEEDLPIGSEGELVVTGPQIMKGYIAQNDETQRALRDGWLYTGDIAKMDEEGFFYIIDRKQDRIISQGHTIWPTKVEEVLLQHFSVESAAVVGISDPTRCATDVQAYVVLKPNMKGKVDTSELLSYCRDRLLEYQVPDDIQVVDKLPVTSMGRVSRATLRERNEISD